MADQSQTVPSAFTCEGGLVLNKSTFMMQPGEALELENFEPDITGGYRRINGYSKYVSAVVPQTASSTEKVLMVATFGSKVLAARGESIYSADPGGASWTSIDSGRTSAGKYRFERYNFDGTDKIIFVDGANAPTIFNSSLTATDVTASEVAGAKHIAAFRDHMFYSGMSSTPQELVFSKPFDEDNFSSGSGSGSIAVDDNIVGIKVFRDNLFIFCENRIFKLAGSSVSDFTISDVTRNIGCINGQTIQEFSGDLIFLAPDGLRTVAGTARIGDVELGTISTPIQTVFNDNIVNSDAFRSVVIPNKTQYRLFFSKSGTTQADTNGVICSLRGEQFEFGKLKGIKPTSTGILVDTGSTTIIHGGSDGYIYQQESGNDFDGTAVNAKYRSPDLSFGDAGVRKHIQRVLVSYKPEAAVNADLFLRYDYEDPNSPRPAAYSLSAEDVVAIYGASVYGVATYGGQTEPLLRQPVEGSGFTVALRVNDDGTSAPYALRGFGVEYQLGARR